MKRFEIFLIGMFFISFLIANEKDWRMYQHDNQRTGFTPYKGGFSQHQIYEMWKETIGGEASLVLGDVDNDNEIEVVVREYWYIDGLSIRNGKTGQLEWVCNLPELSWRDGKSVPVIEDINNDVIKEIVYSHSGYIWDSASGRGRIYALNKVIQDTIWCFKSDTLFFTGVAVEDVDGDGLKEVIFGAGKVTGTQPYPYYYIPSIFILNGEDGSIYWKIDSFFVSQRDKEFYKITGGGDPYPLPVGAYPYLGDLNSDGVCDIIGVKLHSDSTWHLCGIDAKNKNILWENDYSFFGASIGDLDNDGINEIVTSFIKRYYGINKDSIFLRCFEGNTGNLKWEYKTKGDVRTRFSYQPAVADINKDNYKEIVFVIEGGYCFLNIFDKNGNLLHKDSIGGWIWNWNYYECGESYYAPVIADIDNDDTEEFTTRNLFFTL
jgi:hypothetical protein